MPVRTAEVPPLEHADRHSHDSSAPIAARERLIEAMEARDDEWSSGRALLQAMHLTHRLVAEMRAGIAERLKRP